MFFGRGGLCVIIGVGVYEWKNFFLFFLLDLNDFIVFILSDLGINLFDYDDFGIFDNERFCIVWFDSMLMLFLGIWDLKNDGYLVKGYDNLGGIEWGLIIKIGLVFFFGLKGDNEIAVIFIVDFSIYKYMKGDLKMWVIVVYMYNKNVYDAVNLGIY